MTKALAAAIAVLVLAPSTAQAVAPRAMAGSGVATWEYKPSKDRYIPTNLKSEGSVVFKESRTSKRRLELKIEGKADWPFGGSEAPKKISLPVVVTDADHASGKCRVGSKGYIEVFDDVYPAAGISIVDCGLRDRYTTGHAGSRIDVDMTLDPATKEPWSIRFSFKVETPGSDHLKPPKNRKVDISYEMPERYGDRGRDGIVEARTTPDEIDPKGGFPVEIHVRDCPDRGFSLSIDGRGESLTNREKDRCNVTVRLPEGDHEVSASGSDRDGDRLSGSRTIRVQDWLILGLGDSIGSGEGNPDLPINDDRSTARWQERRCHRSAKSYQARTAQALENKDRDTSVTFLHLACSGAAISEGVVGGYGGIVNPAALAPLEAQIAAAKDLIGDREVDAVILSIGANDMKFGDILSFCVKHGPCQDTEYEDGLLLNDWMLQRFNSGRPYYGLINSELGTIRSERIYPVQYPDPLRDEKGKEFCDSVINIAGLRAIREDEARWTFENFLLPLNGRIQSTATNFGWSPVRGAQAAFAPHGYCAEDADRWMVQLTESRRIQGDQNGTMHPNGDGHVALSKLVKKELFRDLYPAPDRPRKPE